MPSTKIPLVIKCSRCSHLTKRCTNNRKRFISTDTSISQSREFFDRFAIQNNIAAPEDWYKVKKTDIEKKGGKEILNQYGQSLSKALEASYPEIQWTFWIHNVPAGFWKDTSNHKNFFDWASSKLGIRTMDDWYSVKVAQLHSLGGETLLNDYYSNSLYKALTAIYPEHDWMFWRFSKIPENSWDSMDNQRKYFNWLEKELGIDDKQGWYKVKLSDIENRGGLVLLRDYYGRSLIAALHHIYPEIPWKIWRFEKVPRHFWDNEANVVEFLKWIADQHGITSFSDWKYTSSDVVIQCGGAYLLNKYGGMLNLVARFLPGVQGLHKREKLVGISKSQIHLYRCLCSIFKMEESDGIHLNYRLKDIVFKDTNKEMELDIFIPKLNLGFEYQGQQHYMWSRLYGDPQLQQQRDQEKSAVCKDRGIDIVQVPYWWDRTQSSLRASIAEVRPGLVDVPKGAAPIPPTTRHKRVLTPSHTQDAAKDEHPFRVVIGLGTAKCRGCASSLQRGDLRIRIKGTFTPFHERNPFCGFFYTHPSANCLHSALKKYGQEGSQLYFPPFQNKMLIGQGILHQLTTEEATPENSSRKDQYQSMLSSFDSVDVIPT